MCKGSHYRKALHRIQAAIKKLKPMNNNLLHYWFLKQALAGQVLDKLRTVPPQKSCGFAGEVDSMLAKAFLERARPQWERNEDLEPEHPTLKL